MTRAEWIKRISERLRSHGRDLTPEILHRSQSAYDYLKELMSWGLSWERSVELYFGSVIDESLSTAREIAVISDTEKT
jgi:hypothetical protein